MTDDTGSPVPGIPQVDVILPCLDEAQALPTVLASLPAGYRAIVVDNGSVDGSPEVAAKLGALVVHETRKGYGAACHRGLESATADTVAFCDADASLDLAELPTLVSAVVDGSADISVGWRDAQRNSGWPIHARVANRFLAWRVRRTTGAQIRDIAPVRVANRVRLLELGVEDRRSGYPLETVIRAARAGWTIAEFPVSYAPRVGRSKVTGTVRGTLTAVKDMSAVLVSQPDRAEGA
ncbi:MAG: glycosyltransferase family 2 protein [Actinobacteria bacterium]|nr:glycosyltransferase family 2 protein [Actinomycetota bacterium]